MADMDKIPQEDSFMAEFIALCKKHGVAIVADDQPLLIEIREIRKGYKTIPDWTELGLTRDNVDPLPEFKM